MGSLPGTSEATTVCFHVSPFKLSEIDNFFGNAEELMVGLTVLPLPRPAS